MNIATYRCLYWKAKQMSEKVGILYRIVGRWEDVQSSAIEI